MKHVRERRREKAAISQAEEAEGCCRTQVRAMKPVTTPAVTRNALRSLDILQPLTKRNFSETQGKDPGN